MAKRAIRTIGQRLQGIARAHIRTYVPTGNMVSRVELPPSWQKNADEPLVWRDEPAPAPVQEEAEPAPVEVEEAAPPAVTPRMLQRLLEAHEERMAREQEASSPSGETAPPAVQRQSESGDSESQPRNLTRRRRGSVIDVPSPSSTTPEENDSPDFFFQNEPASDQVQRRAEPTSPPASRPRQQQHDAPTNSETSFWRGLFTPGADTPDISTERSDEPAFSDEVVEDHETSSQSSVVEPPSVDAPSAPHTPGVQRKTETPVQRRTAQPDVQREVEESPADSSIESSVPADFELDLPAAAEIAPPTPTSPHTIQRQTTEVRAVTPPAPPDRPAEVSLPTTSEAPAAASSEPAAPSVQRRAEPTNQPPSEPHSPTIQRAPESASEPTAVHQPKLTSEAAPASPVQPSIEADLPEFAFPPQSDAVSPVPPASEATPSQPSVQRKVATDAQPSRSPETESTSADSVTPDSQQTTATTNPPAVQRDVSSAPNPSPAQSRSPEPTGRTPAESPRQAAPPPETKSPNEWQDALTMLTPAPEPQSPPQVQRSASSTPRTEEPPIPDFTETDAPTTMTEVAPPSPTARQSPVVQRQVEDAPESETRPKARMPEAPPSPWTEFMRPAERKPERVKRATPPPVQRAPEAPNEPNTSSPVDPSGRSYTTSQDVTGSLPEQPVDLFTALMDAGAVNQPPTTSAPPQISRRTATEPSTPSSSPERRGEMPETSSTDADLLSLIDLPPDTPIIGRTPDEPRVSRAIEPSPTQGMNQSPSFTPSTIEQHSESLDSLMLARPESSPDITSSSVAETGSEGSGESEGGVDVDKLARDVLGVLRKRLRTERERRGGNS